MRSLPLSIALITVLVLNVGVALAQSEFRAEGPTEPVKLLPRQEGAVTVTFDMVPTSMSV